MPSLPSSCDSAFVIAIPADAGGGVGSEPAPGRAAMASTLTIDPAGGLAEVRKGEPREPDRGQDLEVEVLRHASSGTDSMVPPATCRRC